MRKTGRPIIIIINALDSENWNKNRTQYLLWEQLLTVKLRILFLTRVIFKTMQKGEEKELTIVSKCQSLIRTRKHTALWQGPKENGQTVGSQFTHRMGGCSHPTHRTWNPLIGQLKWFLAFFFSRFSYFELKTSSRFHAIWLSVYGCPYWTKLLTPIDMTLLSESSHDFTFSLVLVWTLSLSSPFSTSAVIMVCGPSNPLPFTYLS